MDEVIKKETAILAKEKGFANGCYYLWGEIDGYEGLHRIDNYNHFNDKKQFSAPTQTALANWIRRDYGIHIEIYCNASGFGYILTKLNGTVIKEIEDDVFFESNEDALEAGLKLALLQNKMS